jgi:membrane protease YdiL (CAAX protease family)
VLTPPLHTPVVATFAALAVAMAALWAPRVSSSPRAYGWWVVPFAGALLLALGSGLVNTWGFGALFAFVTACRLAHHAPDGALRGFALAVMLAMSAGLLAHAFPGFANPRVLDAVVLSPDAAPYTKFLNFDKGVMGLLLLGLYARRRTSRPSRVAARDLLVRFALVIAVVLAATVALGFARWDPKLPAWWPLWLASMLFLTALPEEALFRHLVQGGLQHWLGGTMRARWIALGVGGVLFGLAHLAGGWTYVALATLAGLGYGWIYAASDSIAMSILAHTGLNLVHLLFFSYPALERAA